MERSVQSTGAIDGRQADRKVYELTRLPPSRAVTELGPYLTDVTETEPTVFSTELLQLNIDVEYFGDEDLVIATLRSKHRYSGYGSSVCQAVNELFALIHYDKRAYEAEPKANLTLDAIKTRDWLRRVFTELRP